MVTLRLIELRSIIRASLHYKSFALYVTLADWLWQRARANHPTFLPVCARMAAHAHCSVYQSVSFDNYIYGLNFTHVKCAYRLCNLILEAEAETCISECFQSFVHSFIHCRHLYSA